MCFYVGSGVCVRILERKWKKIEYAEHVCWKNQLLLYEKPEVQVTKNIIFIRRLFWDCETNSSSVLNDISFLKNLNKYFNCYSCSETLGNVFFKQYWFINVFLLVLITVWNWKSRFKRLFKKYLVGRQPLYRCLECSWNLIISTCWDSCIEVIFWLHLEHISRSM